MDLSDALKSALLQTLGRPLTEVRAVRGGDINEARMLTAGGERFFLKFNRLPQGGDMLESEAKGLALLDGAGALRTPAVLGWGVADETAYLLLEFVDTGRPSPTFWDRFGAGLAALHRTSSESFGLGSDNFIGSLPQRNGKQERFSDFFAEKRLAPQMRTAREAGLLHERDSAALDRLCGRLESLLPVEPPALIHGDLWGGNFLTGPGNTPVLIDPAVAYAHREMDLAMSRLFGGFDARFYQAYQEAYPTAPGLDERLPLYQLYYLLVHVNLFGGSYTGSVRNILNRFS